MDLILVVVADKHLHLISEYKKKKEEEELLAIKKVKIFKRLSIIIQSKLYFIDIIRII